ncbi:MAG: DUF11 domain-containing protein [Thermoguttaceae bacterium]|nr:DUF11 domain-containing protein [Thermoguttaceae bacterium]
MKFFNGKRFESDATRRSVGDWSARLAAATLVCPLIFCSCQSTDSQGAGSNPYAQNENPYAKYDPKTPEEEAYYRDVYSGEWREQTNVFGTGPSVAKKIGSTTPPPHWETRPEGAKDLAEIRYEAARRNADQARRLGATQSPAAQPFANAPFVPAATQAAYGAPAQTSSFQAADAYPTPTPPATQTLVYPQAQAPTTVYVSQVPQTPEVAPTTVAPQTPAPSSYAPAPTQTVAPQTAETPAPSAAPAAQPTQSVYPQAPYQGASVDRFAGWIVRGQMQDDETEGTENVEAKEVADVESAASEEPKKAAVPEIKPVVELKAENVKTTRVAPNAVAPAPAPSNRIGGQVLPLQVDPSIAAPYANVNRPTSRPLDADAPNAPRSEFGEYVVTGGDSKGPMYSREDWSVENLDKEDSVAHFDTVDGRILSEPTNRLFLYSPRFGAARQVVGPISGESRVMLESANTTTQAVQKEGVQAVDARTAETKPLGASQNAGVASAESLAAPTIGTSRVMLMEADAQLRLHALLTSATVDDLATNDASLMLQGALAAQGWSGEQKVAVALDTVNAFSNTYLEGAGTIYSVKDDTKTSKLRVIKIANKDAARPGELVEFTLRFENIGDEPIGNVTILDNLSARLAYVDNTAKSSVPAEFLAELNEQGSLNLRWEITEPLEPKEFGVVRFICKVR